jgi:hypothetical protein
MFGVIFVCCSTIITAYQIGAIVIRTCTDKIYMHHVLQPFKKNVLLLIIQWWSVLFTQKTIVPSVKLDDIMLYLIGLGLCYLTPLSTIVQLYRGDQFY